MNFFLDRISLKLQLNELKSLWAKIQIFLESQIELGFLLNLGTYKCRNVKYILLKQFDLIIVGMQKLKFHYFLPILIKYRSYILTLIFKLLH